MAGTTQHEASTTPQAVPSPFDLKAIGRHDRSKGRHDVAIGKSRPIDSAFLISNSVSFGRCDPAQGRYDIVTESAVRSTITRKARLNVSGTQEKGRPGQKEGTTWTEGRHDPSRRGKASATPSQTGASQANSRKAQPACPRWCLPLLARDDIGKGRQGGKGGAVGIEERCKLDKGRRNPWVVTSSFTLIVPGGVTSTEGSHDSHAHPVRSSSPEGGTGMI